jgi:hypothetical protein
MKAPELPLSLTRVQRWWQTPPRTCAGRAGRLERETSSCAPCWFDADALAVAEVLGRHASIALAAAREEESLWQAIDARKLIGQAQGILMERFDLDDERAFEVLRRYSQNTNTKLNEVARTLVHTRTLPAYGQPACFKQRTPAGLS